MGDGAVADELGHARQGTVDGGVFVGRDYDLMGDWKAGDRSPDWSQLRVVGRAAEDCHG